MPAARADKALPAIDLHHDAEQKTEPRLVAFGVEAQRQREAEQRRQRIQRTWLHQKPFLGEWMSPSMSEYRW